MNFKTFTFNYRFSSGRFIINDLFYDHPIQYEFLVSKKDESLKTGDTYDIDLFMINTGEKNMKGFIQVNIGDEDYFYSSYDLDSQEKSKITTLRDVKYKEQSLDISIEFWEGPRFCKKC
jgi:hypothetical protein